MHGYTCLLAMIMYFEYDHSPDKQVFRKKDAGGDQKLKISLVWPNVVWAHILALIKSCVGAVHSAKLHQL